LTSRQNALKAELTDVPTAAKFATVQDEGGRLIELKSHITVSTGFASFLLNAASESLLAETNFL
jgi:hypothetical protein